MRFLPDECVDGRIVAGLSSAGHDVLAVRQASGGAGDHLVIEMARREGRVLVTEDKDFGDLVFRHGLGVPGLVLLRYVQSDLLLVLERLLAMADRHRNELHDLHVVITAKRARRRRFPTQPAPS